MEQPETQKTTDTTFPLHDSNYDRLSYTKSHFEGITPDGKRDRQNLEKLSHDYVT